MIFFNIIGLRYIKGFKNKLLYIFKFQPFCTKGLSKYNNKCIRFELRNGSCTYCGSTKNIKSI